MGGHLMLTVAAAILMLKVPDSILTELAAESRAPKGEYVLMGKWEAEEMGHLVGRTVSDPEASGGKAWEARTGRDAPLKHMIFGPYVQLRPGNYVAFFRMKLMEEAYGEIVADLDACVSYGSEVLNFRKIGDDELSLNRYVQVPLPFRYEGGKLECRVLWRGFSSLRVDCVTLFRVEGGDPADFKRRLAPQPRPSGFPRDIEPVREPRPFPDIFPRSKPPAPELMIVDLRGRLPDEQLMVFTLQGIVNRSRPRIYCLFNPTDELWLDWMIKRGWIKRTTKVGPPELLRRFGDEVKGMVIYDPRLPASKNVATMIAAVENGVVLSPRLAERFKLPVLADLRGRWGKDVDAYRWAFDNLWDKLNHHLIACSHPDHLGLRDYLVQNRAFIFWVSGPVDGAEESASPDEEVRLVEELLARMPINIPVMSYPWAGEGVGMGEGPGVTLFSEFGKYLVGSINCTNLSVHSGIRIERFRQKTPPAPKLQRDKVYISFIISDGDNLPVLTTNNFPKLWRSGVRGEIPLGWTISPSAYMLIPDIVDYYYSTASENDRFLAAVSGIGYMYPDSYGRRFRDRISVFDGFLEQTGRYMDLMDLREIWIMGATDSKLISRYAERIPFLRAIFPDYGRRVSGYSQATYPTYGNVPVFHAVTSWRKGIPREEQISRLVSEIRSMTPDERPAFLHVFVLNWFADLAMLKEILHRLGPEYMAVRPDHLAELYLREMRSRELLVRKPDRLVGLEGVPLSFALSIHSFAPSRREISLALLGGLEEGSIEPDEIPIEPAQTVAVVISGIPSGEAVILSVSWDGKGEEVSIPLEILPSGELISPVSKVGKLEFVASFEAADLPHRSGERMEDPEAIGEEAWAAVRGKAEPGFVIYGPYSPLGEGSYLALFRLKRLSDGEGIIATLDTCVGGGSPITSSRDLKAEELPKGVYKLIPLPFDHPGGGVETRVIWRGNADIAVDQIVLWRVVSSSSTGR